MSTAVLILGLGLAGVGSVGSFGAWRAAVILSRIERQRRRAELTPQFEITCTVDADAAGHAELRVILRGPDTLDGLDEVTIRILDERWLDHGARLTPGGPSAEDIAKHIWGSWEFNPGASAQVADNRTTLPQTYSRTTGKDWDRLSLIPTTPPHWSSMTQRQWLRRTDGHPLRLMISCRLADYQWELPYDVPVKVNPGDTQAFPVPVLDRPIRRIGTGVAGRVPPCNARLQPNLRETTPVKELKPHSSGASPFKSHFKDKSS